MPKTCLHLLFLFTSLFQELLLLLVLLQQEQQQQPLQQQLQLLLHLAAEVHSTPMINGVMMKTTIQAAILMAELVVIINSVDGTPIAK